MEEGTDGPGSTSNVRKDSSPGSEDSDESPRNRDEVGSMGLPDDDLDEFLNAENLSDQTPGGLCLYDCSLSTDLERSLSQANPMMNDLSESNITRHIHDLSCSLACEGEKSITTKEDDDADVEIAVERISSAVRAKDNLIKDLCSVLGKANERQVKKARKAKELLSQVSWIKENVDEFSNLSLCSLEDKREDNDDTNANNSLENFRLSSYIRAFASQTQQGSLSLESSKEPLQREDRSIQTSPLPSEVIVVSSPAPPPPNHDQVQTLSKETIIGLCHSFLSATRNLKSEIKDVRQLIRQPYENHEDFPISKILSNLQEIGKAHELEISSYKQQLSAEVKHHHEVQNALKDEIKTLKMRFQDKIKQRESEISELKARINESIEIQGQVNDIDSPRSDPAETPSRPPLDDSFHSLSCDEETFSNLLSRTKVEYLKLTPSEYVEDEVIDTVHIPDSFRQLLEDYKLKLFDMEKKFESNKRYLEEQTHDREVERDEFQHALDVLQQQIEDLRRENTKLYEVNKQNVFQIEEYAARLKNAEEDEMEMVQRHETTEKELKAAVEKIYELRDIIRDLENQVDAMSANAIQLKEQNQVLLDELEKQEMTNKKEQPVFNEQDTYGTIPLDVTDEIQTQIQELARRIEGKINEMDNFQVQTRPNSSCSGVASAISTEDISCRELAGRSSRNIENFAIEDFGSVILNEIRRLESQFESLVRFEDVVMKKLKDSELRCSGQKTKIEELEGQIGIYQEKCSQQALKIADLEGHIDALRFEASNQTVISNLKARLQTVTKQLEDHKNMYSKREQELLQLKEEYRAFQIKQLEKRMEHKEVQVFFPEKPKASSAFDDSVRFFESTFEGVSPEKIRRMESMNPLSTSVISLPRNLVKENHALMPEPELPDQDAPGEEDVDPQRRTGMDASFLGGGDGGRVASSYRRGSSAATSSPNNIKQIGDNLDELHRLLLEKDARIQSLENKLYKGKDGHKRDDKCEQEDVTIDMTLNPDASPSSSPSKKKGGKHTQRKMGPDGEDYVYEATYSSDYSVDGDLLKYIGTKLLHEGPRRANSLDNAQERIAATDNQIEIATLKTQIQQLKRALEEERKKSGQLTKQLKSCEEAKAELRSRSPMTRAPVQNVASSASVHQMQQRELVHQIEEGRKLLNIKHKEVRILQDQINSLENKLSSKAELENELKMRLNSTSALLRRCEEHGRELSSNNQEQTREIRKLKSQLEKLVSRNNNNATNEVCHMAVNSAGGEYLENFLRAKSHRKALAWQKKYLSSVIVMYKSILRQVGHGSEHPDLIQTQIPLAPNAVGLSERPKGKVRFRLVGYVVLAVIRMKYMVNRWLKKRPGEGSPDSEYKASRHTLRVDSSSNSVIRPTKSILIHNNRINSVPHPPALDFDERGENVDTISEYINRFESIENEISSSLSRK